MERFEVFSLGKHYLHVHTEKGFTLYANAKLVNGQLTSYTDKMVRRGGSWVIDVWKFLNKKDFPVNPIYTAVFGFDSEDTAVSVTGTDINVDSISGINGQLVDIGNISLPVGQALPVNSSGVEQVSGSAIYNSDGALDLDALSNLFGVDFSSFNLIGFYGFAQREGKYSVNFNNYIGGTWDNQTPKNGFIYGWEIFMSTIRFAIGDMVIPFEFSELVGVRGIFSNGLKNIVLSF